MELKGLGVIPLIMVYWSVAWISAGYAVTVIYDHASPLMLISETGMYFPETILFLVGFTGMSIATAVLMFLQYKFILLHSEAFGARQALIQKILLAMGWASCVGIVVVATFSRLDYPATHRVGALIAFGLSTIHNLWQSILLHKVPECPRVLCHLRTASCVTAIIYLIIFIGSKAILIIIVCDGDCAEIINVVAVISEWLTLVFILINVVTYYQHFQSLSLAVSRKGCTIALREKDQDSAV